MTRLTISPSGPLRGRLHIPGDKSISVRAVLLGALADGSSRADHWLPADDCLAAVECVRRLGIDVEVSGAQENSPLLPCSSAPPLLSTSLIVHGKGLRGLAEPADVLDCRGSGTTMRLIAGILAGRPFYSVLTGNEQLRRRPMARVAEPLRQMGATVLGRDGGRLPPLTIRGGGLHGIDYTLPVASAQVKSAILLAGLFADGPTTVREPAPTRDHTERMLRAAGVKIWDDKATPSPLQKAEGRRQKAANSDSTILPTAYCLLPTANEGAGGLGQVITLTPDARSLNPLSLVVPGDFSSAAFFIVAACLVPGSELVIEGVGVNPTRTGLLDALARMGAQVGLENRHESGGEPVADLVVRPAGLQAVEVSGDLVPRMIDEFPVFAVAATQAEGETVVRDAAELRVKESDRVAAVVGELRKMGAKIEERPDGFIVEGPTRLRGTRVDSQGDHRLAMALTVAGLVAEGETIVEGAECVSKSFPGFEPCLYSLLKPGWSD
jgi:3-phosphoshikimate 1-carboxyvinyltransferase